MTWMKIFSSITLHSALFFFHQCLEHQESLYFMLENFFSSFNSLYFQVVNELIRMWHKNEQKIAKKGWKYFKQFFMMKLWKLSKEFFKLLMKMSGAIFFYSIEFTISFWFGFVCACVCESLKIGIIGYSEMRHWINVMNNIHWIKVDLVKNF